MRPNVLSETVFRDKWTTLAFLPTRDGSDPEETGRYRLYFDVLLKANVEETDFVEACDRLLFVEEWFPTAARIITVCDDCARDRRMRARLTQPEPTTRRMVCGTCHGARFVRQGGYNPSTRPDVTPVGTAGTRTEPCPVCMTDGQYDAGKDAAAIRRYGGVPDPNADYQPDMTLVTWPARMDALRNPLTGRVDMDALYRLSRELRGLDPDIDERPANVRGWKAAGSVAAREMVPA